MPRVSVLTTLSFLACIAATSMLASFTLIPWVGSRCRRLW